jgi:hypothetical protein
MYSRLAYKLTLISAPAGFGKTTLVSQWLYKRAGEQFSPVPPPLPCCVLPGWPWMLATMIRS